MKRVHFVNLIERQVDCASVDVSREATEKFFRNQITYTMSCPSIILKGNLVVGTKSAQTNSSCLKSRQQFKSKKISKPRRKQVPTRKTNMPPSIAKDCIKNEFDAAALPWPTVNMNTRTADMFIAPPAPLNSTEYIMDNYYEAERTINETASTPERLFVDEVTPFNTLGSMFNVHSQVIATTRCK